MQLMGHKFGWTDLSCTDGAASGRLQLTVLQPSGRLELAYRVLLIILVVAIVFCMGNSIELRVVLRLVKRPVALSIGWACQFLLMPHLGLAVGQLLLLALAQFSSFPSPKALAFGLLTYACSPGGGGSNMWTYLLDGDLDLSMTMTFFSSICAFFMMPLWLFVYGRLYIDPDQVRIPFDQVAYTLLQSVVPLALGVLVRYKVAAVRQEAHEGHRALGDSLHSHGSRARLVRVLLPAGAAGEIPHRDPVRRHAALAGLHSRVFCHNGLPTAAAAVHSRGAGVRRPECRDPHPAAAVLHGQAGGRHRQHRAGGGHHPHSGAAVLHCGSLPDLEALQGRRGRRGQVRQL
ncbi:hypothetical protein BOX15_Mlig023656g1 [Macrostomum lignano]|uniref:Uncharacterized protein n=1 Tax=Macrostomum lignano TaxID=282301 RepID=A0A267DGT2_9PLAT|nr:hypothetical protein BOX15_Mlig023656g1 [Macrostomum lignano]